MQVPRFLPNPEANWGPKRKAWGQPRPDRHARVRGSAASDLFFLWQARL
jgi:hypothetical protein